jgi:hypothetical protein
MLDLLLKEMKNQMRGSEARAGSKRKGRERKWRSLGSSPGAGDALFLKHF